MRHISLSVLLAASLWACGQEQAVAPSGPEGDMGTPEGDMGDPNEGLPFGLRWLDQPSTLQIAAPVLITAEVADRDPEPLTSEWTLASATAPGVDCSHLLQALRLGQVQILLPGDVDERCADRLLLRWEVSNDTDTATLTHELEVVPTPGRVTDFVPLADNPQPDIGGCPSWHCLNHSDPTPGRLPDGSLALWAATSGLYDDPTYQHLPVVGRFVQRGEAWVADDEPSLDPLDVPEGGWALARETPSVRWNPEARRWDMWFLGYRQDYFTDPALGQLRSMDEEGSRWGSSPSPIYRPAPGAWDEDFITSPGALRGSDGVWRLYYSGASFAIDNGRLRVGVLTSQDGQTWAAPQEPVVFEGEPGQWDTGVLDPHVQFVGGRYVMWYTGYVPPLDVDSSQLIAVGVATSEDGYHFTRLREEPILAPVPDSWSDKRVLDVEVLREADGSLLMVGYGESNTVPHPFNPELFTGRIGLWRSP